MDKDKIRIKDQTILRVAVYIVIMGTITIFDPDSEESESIEANLDTGYDVLFEELQANYDSEQEAVEDICRFVEATIIDQIQESSDGPEIHKATAVMINALKEEGMIDVDGVVQQSIHKLVQMTES